MTKKKAVITTGVAPSKAMIDKSRAGFAAAIKAGHVNKVPTTATIAAMKEARTISSTLHKPVLTEAPPKSLLQRAHDTIHGQRQLDYGDKLQNFSQIAMIFQGMLAHKLLPSAKITPEDVALLMIGVKASRLAKSPTHTDSWLDIAGYAGCADHLQQERLAGVHLLGATVDTNDPDFQ